MLIKSMPLLLLLLVSFILPSISDSPIYNLCPKTSQNFSTNSTYNSNIDLLLSSLSNSSNPFSSYSIGTFPNQVHGLAFCRGDADPPTCASCLSAAASNIQILCQNNMQGAIWYDYCQILYSNHDVIHQHNINNSYQYTIKNPNYVPPNKGPKFETLVIALMENVSGLAVRNKKSFFATGEAKLSSNETIFGHVQCALDLSGDECGSCLRILVDLIDLDDDKFCEGRRALGLWCNMRYEFFKFYNGKSAIQLSYDQILSPPSPSPSPTPSLSVEGKKTMIRRKVRILLPLGILLLISIIACLMWMMKKSGKGTRKQHTSQILSFQGIHISSMLKMREINLEFLLIDFSSILKATCNFSAANKLGQGGFGSVYKGQLQEGEYIAVKRLDKCSGQGLEEFMNEIKLIAKLQHRNLVKLLGCSIEGDEKLIIYEYLPNNSLDYHLFDTIRKEQLHWSKRYSIIEGIAQGLLYLHKYSRVRIIHRDLKASNILLDLDMNPKISDFGIARIFDANITKENTNRIVGTYGYMSPEYALEGLFSIKSDVFSFGVLILEIISGERNTTFHRSEKALNLLSYAWELWKKGYLMDFVDPTLDDKIYKEEISNCIIVALMCVQENPIDRPITSEIIAMLGSENTSLLNPKKPAFFTTENEGNSNLSRHIASQNDITLTDLDGR